MSSFMWVEGNFSYWDRRSAVWCSFCLFTYFPFEKAITNLIGCRYIAVCFVLSCPYTKDLSSIILFSQIYCLSWNFHMEKLERLICSKIHFASDLHQHFRSLTVFPAVRLFCLRCEVWQLIFHISYAYFQIWFLAFFIKIHFSMICILRRTSNILYLFSWQEVMRTRVLLSNRVAWTGL